MATTKRVRRSAGQLFRLCIVNGSLDEGRVRRVVDGAVRSRRRGIITVLQQFLRLVRLDRERHTARVQSAAPLPDPIRRDVEASVARTYGAGLQTSFTENPALIGGVRIQVGSDVYDGSVRARLDAIEAGF